MAENPDKVTELTDLPNVGAVLAERLRRAGIGTPADLRKAGSVRALLRVRRAMVGDKPCVSMLCALEGAIRGVRWHEIPRAERSELWSRYQVLAK
jgi:DNA transformation protein